MIKRLPEVFVFIFILTALFLATRQQVTSDDRWFNFRQIWHHEKLIAVFVFGAVYFIAGKYLGRFKRQFRGSKSWILK